MRLAPGPAALLLAAAAVSALLMERPVALGILAALLLAICRRVPASRSRPYVIATASSALGVFLVWPLLQTTGLDVLWEGPVVPVVGLLDVTEQELVLATVYALRLAAVGLAFAVYALLVDHDRLVAESLRDLANELGSAHVVECDLAEDPLAAVRESFNAVFVEGAEVGELMFFGRGAGAGPTGTAVVGDIVEIARNIVTGGRSPGCTCYRSDARIRPRDETKARYYIVLSVAGKYSVKAPNGTNITGFGEDLLVFRPTSALADGSIATGTWRKLLSGTTASLGRPATVERRRMR